MMPVITTCSSRALLLLPHRNSLLSACLCWLTITVSVDARKLFKMEVLMAWECYFLYSLTKDDRILTMNTSSISSHRHRP